MKWHTVSCEEHLHRKDAPPPEHADNLGGKLARVIAFGGDAGGVCQKALMSAVPLAALIGSGAVVGVCICVRNIEWTATWRRGVRFEVVKRLFHGDWEFARSLDGHAA